jgi:hypothetical protein
MGMMAQPLPPVPKQGPPEQEAPPLAQAPQEPQGNEVKDQAQTIMRQLMDMRRANESMAAQYPPAAKDLRAANEALKAAMLKIVRELQQTPGSSPSPPVGPG